MSSLAEIAAENKSKMEGANPANLPQKPEAERTRVPMTNATRKLEVNEIPGYHLQWLKGDARVQQALRAGFEFVQEHEVDINSVHVGNSVLNSGNTDMGTRVSITAGGMGANSQPERLYLMKQRKEYYDEDQRLLQSRNDSVADALTAGFHGGTIGVGAEGAPHETPMDIQQRYVDKARTKIPDLFRRKRTGGK